MKGLANVIAVARAEARLTRRLARYWVFLSLSYLIGLIAYFYYALLHTFGSSWSASAASIGPVYLIGAVGSYYVLVFLVGTIFLGFDIRARDVRERMSEVLDSRPFTNLELVLGRFLGLLVPAWIPVVVIAALLEGLGLLLQALDSPIGQPLEPYSLLAFTVFLALPAFAFALALVFVVTLVVRNRLIATAVLLVALVADVWALVRLPFHVSPLLDVTGGTLLAFPSELVPGVSDGIGWLQRVGVMVMAFGMLVLCSAIHPRLDRGSRGRTAAMAVLVVLAGYGVVGLCASSRWGDVKQMRAWRQAHEARAEEVLADLESVSATVEIDPGRELVVAADLGLRAPSDTPLERVLLALNPGLGVRSLRTAEGGDLAFRHESGLLDIDLAVAAGGEATVHLEAVGVPDGRFAYLDSARSVESVEPAEGQIGLLGTERALFDPRYVALMPGIGWLPTAGPLTGRDDPARRPADFFRLELTVEVPQGWLVAGPGRRDEIGREGDRVRYRFNPGAPVPEVAVIASSFEARSAEVEGVHVEVLLHPGHTGNLEVLADAADEIRGWISDRLREAAAVGLPYPYQALTMVEVPTTLRGYGGGWRMDTVMAPPTMLLVRESGFPTARFDAAFRDPEDFRDVEGGMPRAKRDRLEAHFVNDFSGGNPFIGAARNFVIYQTAARGAEGLALNYVLENLSTLLVTGTRGYFSAHIYGAGFNSRIQGAFVNYFAFRGPDETFADSVIDLVTSRPEVWETALGVALADLDPHEDPSRTVDVLTLKGGALARSVLDSLGREKAGSVLATLRNRHRGETFTAADLVAAGREAGADLDDLLAEWLASSDLPGFVGQGTESFRLRDGDDGSPRYQLLVEVRNDEPTAGMLRVAYWTGEGREARREVSEPIRVEGRSAIEFGVVLPRPPTIAVVEPYLSLNRSPFRVPLATVDEEKIVRRQPYQGVRERPWQQLEDGSITIDDLDDGFSVAEGDGRRGTRLGSRSTTESMDQGLPAQLIGSPPPRWSRLVSGSAWGRYRHTTAAVRPGAGKRPAVFTTTIPEAMSWELELHLPSKRRFFAVRSWGMWNLEVVDASGREQASFDSNAASQGWNLVGTFELDAGEVAVELSDKAKGQVVVADAIRWRPAAAMAEESR